MGLLDFLFGTPEERLESDWNGSWRETGHNYSHSSGNWTDADDWQCGEFDHHDGMFGFDSFDEYDF